MASEAPGPVLIRHPLTDPKTGLVSGEWAFWFEQLRSVLATAPAVVSATPSGTYSDGSVPWLSVNKLGSRLADLIGRSASDLDSGTLAVDRVPSQIPADRISTGIVDNPEFDTLDGITGNIQQQLNAKMVRPPTRNAGWVNFFPANQTAALVGFPGPLSSAGETATDVSQPDRLYKEYASTAVDWSGVRIGGPPFFIANRYDPTFVVDLWTGPVLTNLRIWAALVSDNLFSLDTGNVSLVGFRYSTAVGDPGWVGMCADGLAADFESTGLIAAIAPNTHYVLSLTVSGDGTLATFRVNEGAALTLAVHLPSTIAMGWQVGFDNLDGAAKSLNLGKVFLEWD